MATRPEDSDDRAASPAGRAPRLLLGIAWLKTTMSAASLLAAFAILTGQDPAGRDVLSGGAATVCVYWALFVLPALRLASAGRHLGLCLALLIGPDLVLVALAAFT